MSAGDDRDVGDRNVSVKENAMPASASGVGHKKPPVESQWKKGVSGNPNGKKKSIDLKALVQKANAKKVTVQMPDGSTKKIPQGEVVLEKLAHQAIDGDVTAHKILVKYAKIYATPNDEHQNDYYLMVDELDEISFKFMKGFELIPADCGSFDELTLTEIKIALKKYNKIWANPEERKRLLDKAFGPIPTDKGCE